MPADSVSRNQYRDSPVSTRPLSGIGVGSIEGADPVRGDEQQPPSTRTGHTLPDRTKPGLPCQWTCDASRCDELIQPAEDRPRAAAAQRRRSSPRPAAVTARRSPRRPPRPAHGTGDARPRRATRSAARSRRRLRGHATRLDETGEQPARQHGARGRARCSRACAPGEPPARRPAPEADEHVVQECRRPGRATRSTDEWLMSRSCHSAWSSMPASA